MPQAKVAYNNVLVVDDSEIDQLIVKKVIEITLFAHKVVSKNTGQSALEYLTITPQKELPEIIFLDLNMPVLDGLGFLKVFETLPSYIIDTCKIIVLSSSTNKNDLSNIVDNKFVKKIISKPLTIDIITELSYSSF